MNDRPSIVHGKTIRGETGCGNIYITLNTRENRLFEVFINIGKGGVCTNVQCAALAMITSTSLRSGVDPEVLMRKLLGHQCDRYDGSPLKIMSCPDALGRAIGYYLGKYNEELQPIAPIATGDLKVEEEVKIVNPGCTKCAED